MKESRVARLQNVDRRLIYAIITVGIVFPLLFPFSVPVRVGDSVEEVYQLVDSLPADSIVMISFDLSAGSAPETFPIAEAVLQHLATKDDVRVVALSFYSPDGPEWGNKGLQILKDAGKVYGVDYINLGYRAGGEGAVALAAKEMHTAFPTDMGGEDVAQFSIMKGLHTAEDIDLFFSVSSSGPDMYIRQLAPYGVPVIPAVSFTITPGLVPLYDSGDLAGLLGGLRAAAEYENRIGVVGSGNAVMGAELLGHVVILVFLAIGNATYFLNKRSNQRAKGGV